MKGIAIFSFNKQGRVGSGMQRPLTCTEISFSMLLHVVISFIGPNTLALSEPTPFSMCGTLVLSP